MKKISILILSVILMMGVSGCMQGQDLNYEKKPSLETAQNKVIEHLNQKYNEEFKIVASETPGITRDFYTFLVAEKEKTYEECGFDVYYHFKNDHKIEDGYFGIVIRDKIEIYIKSLIKSDTAQVFVTYNVSTFDEDLIKETDISEKNKVSFMAYVFDKNISSYKNNLSNWNYKNVSGQILAYSLSDLNNNLTYENYKEYVTDILKKNVSIKEQLSIEVE